MTDNKCKDCGQFGAHYCTGVPTNVNNPFAADKFTHCGLDLTIEQKIWQANNSTKPIISTNGLYQVGEKWYAKRIRATSVIEVEILHKTEKTVKYSELSNRSRAERTEWSDIKFIELIKEDNK